MSQVILDCPICGLPLAVLSELVKAGTDTVKNGELGGHIHIEPQGTAACANGHRWNASGSFLLTRV